MWRCSPPITIGVELPAGHGGVRDSPHLFLQTFRRLKTSIQSAPALTAWMVAQARKLQDAVQRRLPDVRIVFQEGRAWQIDEPLGLRTSRCDPGHRPLGATPWPNGMRRPRNTGPQAIEHMQSQRRSTATYARISRFPTHERKPSPPSHERTWRNTG